jgi:hypothetical protein
MFLCAFDSGFTRQPRRRAVRNKAEYCPDAHRTVVMPV